MIAEAPDLVRSGVDSVFEFIRRTAEPEGTGYRWKTADYENRLQYNITLFNGVGGIPLFLIDYGRVRGNAQALELARGALEWCAQASHERPVRGLHFGKVGPALAALELEKPLSPELNRLCDQATRSILQEEPGPVTDMVGGASSNGYYLLRAWKKTGDRELLKGAVRCGEWVRQQMIRDEIGTYCWASPDGKMFGSWAFTGFAHGISGVAFFFTLLFEATGNKTWKQAANELFETLIAHAQEARGGWNWSPDMDRGELKRCQWSHGAPGIGLPFLRAAEAFKDARWLNAATMAGEATYAYGDFRHNATQCTGLAGGGDFLLELWKVTGQAKWLERANEFGEKVLAYRDNLPEGAAWPTDEPGLHSADFMYGAAGIGHFLLRLETRGEVPLALG